MRQLRKPQETDRDVLMSVLPTAAKAATATGRSSPTTVTVVVAVVQHAAVTDQCCQMAKFDPFLSLDCARVEGVGAQSKERKGSNFAV